MPANYANGAYYLNLPPQNQSPGLDLAWQLLLMTVTMGILLL